MRGAAEAGRTCLESFFYVHTGEPGLWQQGLLMLPWANNVCSSSHQGG